MILINADKDGLLQEIMNETVDGEYQNFKSKEAAILEKNSLGKLKMY